MHGAEDGGDPDHHRITAAQLDELCGGGGGPATIRTLWSGQRSRRLLLIDTVMSQALADPAALGPLPPPSAAWAALTAADEVASEACTRLLLHPQVGAWAAYVLRRARGRAASEAPFWVDAGVVHTLALLAGARAALPWRTLLPARDGHVMLPALGTARFPGLPRWSCVEATTGAGEIRLRAGGTEVVVPDDPGREAPGWWPLRRLVAGDDVRLSVFLDDLDPYRELADPVGPDRLGAAEAERWSRLLDGAWALLSRYHRDTAEALAAAVVTVVPLPSYGSGASRSASTGEAFGSVMTSPPLDEVDLAVTLVHEFQHIKLGGLTHLIPLADERDAPRPVLYAPWRDDPRPLPGLLQGIYAFSGIAEFWRVRRHGVADRDRPVADFEFAYARGQVEAALAQVAGAPELTDAGRRLVSGLSARLASWRGEHVDPDMGTVAGLLAAGHRAEWRLRHLRPDPGRVVALTRRWPVLDGTALAALPATIEPDPRLVWSLGWQQRVRSYAYQGASHGSPAGEAALLSGELTTARAAYAKAVDADPGDLRAWAGLSLTAGAGEPLRDRPEVVRACYLALRDRGVEAGPEAVADALREVAGSGE